MEFAYLAVIMETEFNEEAKNLPLDILSSNKTLMKKKSNNYTHGKSIVTQQECPVDYTRSVMR